MFAQESFSMQNSTSVKDLSTSTTTVSFFLQCQVHIKAIVDLLSLRVDVSKYFYDYSPVFFVFSLYSVCLPFKFIQDRKKKVKYLER